MPYRTGDVVGDYEVLQLLGRGACGEVFRVRRRAGAAPVALAAPALSARGSGVGVSFALKAIPCEALPGETSITEATTVAPDASAEAALPPRAKGALAEARLLQGLRHPHIVACQEVFFDKDLEVVRIVLEYMDGGDLHGCIDRQREDSGELFPAHFARRVLAAVGGALDYVHGVGVLHRDVKPANVLLAKCSLRIKLADFGIAKLVEASTLKAKTLVGTPHYFSPELVSGEEYGSASDCWALGACLYEVAALKRPFDASNQLALVRRICEEQPAELPDSIADDVREAISGLLEKRPQSRLTLPDALTISSAVAALVVIDPEDCAEADVSSQLLDVTVHPADDSMVRGGATPEARGGSSPTPGGAGARGGPPRLPAMPAAPAYGVAMPPPGAPPAMGSQAAQEASGDEGLDGDSWLGAERVQTWVHLSGAVAQARAALAADVDDPEDLQLALWALERERRAGNTEDPADLSALDSLCAELRVRLRALTEEAAALLEGLLQDTEIAASDGGAAEITDVETTEANEVGAAAGGIPLVAIVESENGPLTIGPAPPSAGAGVSTPRNLLITPRSAADSAEEAIEKASTLGVDTGLVEERLAYQRKMLSIRVVWGKIVRFFTLPLKASFAWLSQQVTARFELAAGSPLNLYWSEGGQDFAVDSQAAWDECLQLRGLAEKPGRLELRVRGRMPRRRVRPAAAKQAALAEQAALLAAQQEDHGPPPRTQMGRTSRQRSPYEIVGRQALQAPTTPATRQSTALAEMPRRGGRSGSSGPRGRMAANASTTRRMEGKAWAMSTGREQPVHWAPSPGRTSSGPNMASTVADLGLCLEGRPAATDGARAKTLRLGPGIG